MKLKIRVWMVDLLHYIGDRMQFESWMTFYEIEYPTMCGLRLCISKNIELLNMEIGAIEGQIPW
jgi:hypothetical protein